MTQEDIFPVVVIGAGLAGLSAARHLAARDIPPMVLEADTTWPGGRLAGGDADTFEHQARTWSFPSEHGAHALWGAYDNMRAMLERFLDIELRESEGEEWINRWGNAVRYIEAGQAVRSRWLPAPFHYLQLLFRPRFWATITPLDFLSLPGFILSIIWTLGLDPIREEIALDGLKMKEYFRGWTPNLKATFTGLGVNLLASNAEEINLTAFIAAIRFYTMLRRDAWKLEYLPANSHTCIIQPLIEGIETAGGMVMKGARATRLERKEDYWRISVEDVQRGGTRSLEAEHIILAVNPAAAQEILDNSPDISDRAEEIKFPPVTRSSAIRLWFDAAPRDGAPGGMLTGDFMFDNFFWLHRLHDEFKGWHELTGGSAVEVHNYNRDEVLDQPDQLIMIMAANEIQRAFPTLRGHLVHAAVRHNGYTQTQFVVPTEKSLDVDTPWSGIFACGDWIGHPTPALWMERCTVTGIDAANHIIRAYNKQPFEVIAPCSPELPARVISGTVYFLRKLIGPLVLRIGRLFSGRHKA
jgi:isorenieratene synthase